MDELREVHAFGFQVLAIGNIGVLISFVLKNVPVINRAPIPVGTTEAVITSQIPSITPANEQTVCTTCGSTVANNSTFCTNCGVAIHN